MNTVRLNDLERTHYFNKKNLTQEKILGYGQIWRNWNVQKYYVFDQEEVRMLEDSRINDSRMLNDLEDSRLEEQVDTLQIVEER